MSFTKSDGALAPLSATPQAGDDHFSTSAVDTWIGTARAESFWLGEGDTAAGGAGDDTYYLQGGSAISEAAGGGIDTVAGWQNIDLTRYANVENASVNGGGLYAAGNALDNVLVGDAGAQQFYGGLGRDVLVGGGGADTFIVVKGEGDDVVQDFSVDDVLRLTSTYTTFAQVKAHLTQAGADVKLDLGDNSGVTFRGATVDQFAAKNFALTLDTTKLGSLAFNEEFTSLSIWDQQSNPTGVWRPDYGYNGDQGTGSYTLGGEQQLYTSPYFWGASGGFDDGNFRLNADGTLTIIAHASDNATVGAQGYHYTSGLLQTGGVPAWMPGGAADANQFAQQYGYFEMRADLSEVPHSWGAFWLLEDNWSWPPEVDVVENPITGDGSANLAWTTTHSAASGDHTQDGHANYIPGSTEGFHTYGVLWTKEALTYYVDRVAVYSTAVPADLDAPARLLVNLAVGGWAGATADPNYVAEMTIDYIKAWRLADGSSIVEGSAALPDGVVTPPPVITPPPVTNPPPVITPPPPPPAHVDPTLSAADAGAHAEGSTFTFTVTRSGDLSQQSLADYYLWTDKADAGDFTGVMTGTVRFAPGEASQTISIATSNDTTVEKDEVFHLELSNGRGATIADGEGDGVILNNDVAFDQPGWSYAGGSKNDQMDGSPYNDTISGGSGNDTLAGGTGNDRITGGSGHDVFVFDKGFGHDTIADFKPGVDDLFLRGFGADHGHAAQVGANTVITFDTGDTVTLLGVKAAAITASDWIFN